jgi:hypothetical protein
MAATIDVARSFIQSGECFNPPPDVGEFDDIGAQLGSKGTGAQSMVSTITETWSSACSNLSATLSVTEMQKSIIESEAKAQGREATPEEIDEACGPLSFLTKVPTILDEALTDIFGKFDEFATSFGETVGEFMAKFDQLVADVVGAVDEVAQAIAQAALDAFELANKAALEAIEAIESVVNSVVGAVDEAIAFATNAFNSAVAKLSAWADTLNFASIFGLDCQDEALAAATDPNKIADAAEVNRVLSPPVVDGTDPSVTDPTLSTPQTTFAPAPSTTFPPDIDQLIKKYQTAARNWKKADDEIKFAPDQGRRSAFTPAQRKELDTIRQTTLQELRIAALAQGIDLNSLPIYGSNFDQIRVQISSTASGRTEYTKTDGIDPKLQEEINEIKRDLALYNRLNDEQFREIRNQKGRILIGDTGGDFGGEVRATNRKKKEAEELKISIEERINKSRPGRDTETVKKAVGPVKSIRTGLFF